MKFRNVAVIGLAAIMTMSLAACGGGSSDKSSSSASSSTASASSSSKSDSSSESSASAQSGDYDGKVIAYLTPSLDIPFWNYVKHGVEDQVAKEMPGAEVTVYDSKDNANTQLSNAQDAITKNVDGIVISPTDSASCVAVLTAAEEAEELGEYVASKLNEGDEVAQITLNQARINGVLRKEGFEKGIGDKLTQVDFRQMEKVNRNEGVSYTQDLITSYPDLKAIFCHSEDPSMGAVTALKEIGNTDCLIAGFDCSPEVVDAIKSGDIVATAAQQPVLMGRTSVDCLKTYFDGDTPDKEVTLGTMLVTVDNIEEIYDDLYAVALES